jgi:4-amino-4-deoxy-L-arabinose transferase-like glycosyltransferase
MTGHWTFPPRGPLFGREIKISSTAMWAIFWIGAGSFIPLLFLQYVGEEGVYPIATQEMHATGDFFRTTNYGRDVGRPGLYCWLILALTRILGEQYILLAARLIAASSTLLIGLTLAWLVRRIFKDSVFAAFTAAVFLSGDVLLYRGWLAYVDPLFSLLTFGAMSALWVAVEERRRSLLILAAVGLIGSFLAKALTGYVFYGVFALVLLCRHGNWRFLFKPWSVAIHCVAVAFPFVWTYAIVGDSVVWAMLYQILYNAKQDSAFDAYAFVKLFIAYPFRTFLYLLPTSAVVLYGLLSKEIAPAAFRQNSVLIALLTAAINVLPYWIAPASSPRYLMPIYPFAALAMVYAVLNGGHLISDLCVKGLIATVGIAYVAALVGFPAYEQRFRGSYDKAAQAIIARAGNIPIFATDDTSMGLSIVAGINARRSLAPPVTRPPPGFPSGVVLASRPDPAIGQVEMIFTLGHDIDGRRTRYLLCRGDRCSRDGAPSAGPLSF